MLLGQKKCCVQTAQKEPGQKPFLNNAQFVWRVSVYTIAQNMFRTISCAEIPAAGACYTPQCDWANPFPEDLSIGEDMMFLMDLLMQISSVSITEYRGYFYRINEQGAMLKPFKPSYMDEIKSWELACRLVEKEFPSQKGRVYSILAVSAMLAAGKIARLPGAERKKYQTEVVQCRSAVQKGLAASGGKRGAAEGLSDKNDAVHRLSGVVSCVVSSLERLK